MIPKKLGRSAFQAQKLGWSEQSTIQEGSTEEQNNFHRSNKMLNILHETLEHVLKHGYPQDTNRAVNVLARILRGIRRRAYQQNYSIDKICIPIWWILIMMGGGGGGGRQLVPPIQNLHKAHTELQAIHYGPLKHSKVLDYATCKTKNPREDISQALCKVKILW